jgi:hypothetical protein
MKHKLTKLTLAAVILAALCCGSVPTLAQVVGQPADKPFATDPAVKSKLDALPARTGLMLGKFKVEADEATVKRFPSLGRNPGRRDYGNKMAYAADRGTAFYCGANHGVPHRISDVWEFNLLANTWRLVLPPRIQCRRPSTPLVHHQSRGAHRQRGRYREEQGADQAIR